MFNVSQIFFILLFLILPSAILFSQDGMDQSAEMKMWMDYMTPGPMHELLGKSVGDWKTTSKFWMDPAGEPMVTEGSGKTEMILGGRYQKSTHNSTLMGMPTEGISLTGFDNATQEFTTIWIDNVGTGTAVAKGKYDQSTNSIVFYGSMVDPMIKQEMKFREILKFIDNDHHLLEMYVFYNNEEFKSMEIEFIRQ